MNVMSMSLFAVACAAFVGGGYLRLFRWEGSPSWLRWGVWGLCLLSLLGAWCLRTPLLFGADRCLSRWLRGLTHEGGRWEEIEGERGFQHAQGQVLGEYVRSQVKSGRCVILCPPELVNVEGRRVADVTVTGLRRGLGDGFAEILELEVPMSVPARLTEDGELRTGLAESGWTPEALTGLLRSAGDWDVLISCVPLPEGCFGEAGEVLCEGLRGKRIALSAGAWGGARKAVAGGGVLAAVGCAAAPGPGAVRCPEDPREAFSQRYVLMTREGDVTFGAVGSEN